MSRREMVMQFGASAVALLACTGALAQATGSSNPTRFLEERPDERWTLQPVYTYSRLSGGNPDRNGFDLLVRYRPTPTLSLGASVETQRRPPDTDVGYGASFSWTPVPDFEWHGNATWVPDADFWADETYVTGVEWRTGKLFSLLFDYQRENYSVGSIDQYTPGLSLWLAERSWITGKYTFGYAYGEQHFHSYSVALYVGLPEDGRVWFRFTHGGDPDKEPGGPVTLTTSTIYELSWRWPLSRTLFVNLGAEYEDRKDSYTRTSLLAGVEWRF